MEHLEASLVTADRLQIITRPHPYTVFGSKPTDKAPRGWKNSKGSLLAFNKRFDR